MNKKYLYIGGITLAGIALIVLVWFFARSPEPSGNADRPLAISGLNGKKVYTKDFVINSKVFGNVALLYTDSQFSINFDRTENNFAITLSGSTKAEIMEYRNKSESLLILKLGISKAETCNVSVGEIIVNYEALGLSQQVFPLSFCPGGEKFPQ